MPHPLLKTFSKFQISQEEPFLLIEFIDGETILAVSRKIHHGIWPFAESGFFLKSQNGDIDEDKLAFLTIKLFFQLAEAVCELQSLLISHGYLYSDLSLRNIIVPKNQIKFPIRIIDGGSIVPIERSEDTAVHYTLDYLPPDVYNSIKNGKKVWPDEKQLVYSLGVLLWQLLTGAQPIPGEFPKTNNSIINKYPGFLKNILDNFLNEKHSNI